MRLSRALAIMTAPDRTQTTMIEAVGAKPKPTPVFAPSESLPTALRDHERIQMNQSRPKSEQRKYRYFRG